MIQVRQRPLDSRGQVNLNIPDEWFSYSGFSLRWRGLKDFLMSLPYVYSLTSLIMSKEQAIICRGGLASWISTLHHY